MELILGVDGGGTKTIARISDFMGKSLADHESGPSNFKSIGVEETINNINIAVMGAIDKIGISEKIFFKSSCFGMAGIDSIEDEEAYTKIIFNIPIKNYLNPGKTIICND